MKTNSLIQVKIFGNVLFGYVTKIYENGSVDFFDMENCIDRFAYKNQIVSIKN